jgi:hypothetical protein
MKKRRGRKNSPVYKNKTMTGDTVTIIYFYLYGAFIVGLFHVTTFVTTRKICHRFTGDIYYFFMPLMSQWLKNRTPHEEGFCIKQRFMRGLKNCF